MQKKLPNYGSNTMTRISAATFMALLSIATACKQPGAATAGSDLQTLDNVSGRNNGWQANTCGSPKMLDSHSWNDQQGVVAQELNDVRSVIESTNCIIVESGNTAMKSTATSVLMAASPAVVKAFCRGGGKVKVATSLAEESCHDNDPFIEQFRTENSDQDDFRTCLTNEGGTPVLVVQEKVIAIQHTLIRGVSYLYSGFIKARKADPQVAIEWAYMTAIKDTFMEELKKYPAAYEKWKDANPDALTQFIYAEAIDQVQCDSGTFANLGNYKNTRDMFFDTAVATKQMQAKGVQVPAGFQAFGVRAGKDARFYLPWYQVVPDA